MAINLQACFVVAGIAIAFNAAAQERSSQGSQLKTAPAPARSTLTSPAPASKPAPAPARSGLTPPAPASTPAPPVITTAAIRLLGMSGGKEQAKLPAVIATQGLQLWGTAAPGGTVKTASLVLLGAVKESIAVIPTEPIRLWGLP